jgi:phage protein D
VRPAYRIIANGADLAAVIGSRLKSISITDAAGFESDTLEISMADDPAAPIEIPPTGAELEVWLGYAESGLQRMGVFVVDEIEVEGPPDSMTIRGRAAPMEASKGGKSDLQTQKTRAWPKGTKLKDMVAKIAKEHGLEPAVAKSLQSITLPQFDQTEESDISFLVRVCRKYDAVAKPGGGKLAVAKRGESKSASGEDMPTVVLQREGTNTRWSMNISTRDSEGTVVAFYHDRGAAKRKEVTAGTGDPVRKLRHNFPDKDSAEKAAQAELDKRGRRKNKLAVSMPGDSMLAAECKLQLVGFRTGVPTDWLVTQVVHKFDTGTGYSCDVEAEKPKDGDEE